MKKPKHLEFIGDVYKDIYAIEINDDDSIKILFSKFYKIMKKHGICQGTWTENGIGRIMSNPEWVICEKAFEDSIISKIKFNFILNEPPKELLAYGKKPKIKKLK